MAWDEWEYLKAEALARQQQDRMQVNSTGSGGPADAVDLRMNVPGKTAAIKLLQPDGDISRNTDRAGRHAEENSDTAVREFTGWDTGSGLKDAHNEWELQVKNLMNRLDADRAALEGTKRHFQYLDHGVRSQIAQIDAGLDPRHGT